MGSEGGREVVGERERERDRLQTERMFELE